MLKKDINIEKIIDPKRWKFFNKISNNQQLVFELGHLNPEVFMDFEKAERIDDYDTENSEKFYSSFRIPLLIFNLLLAVYLFWVIGKILKIIYYPHWPFPLLYYHLLFLEYPA